MALLERNNLVQNGKLVPATARPPREDRIAINSIVDYLVDSHREVTLEGWPKQVEGSDNLKMAIMKAMNVSYMNAYEFRYDGERSERNFNISFRNKRNDSVVLAVSGYDYIINSFWAGPSPNHSTANNDSHQPPLKLNYNYDSERSAIIITTEPKQAELVLPLGDVIAAWITPDMDQYKAVEQPLEISGENDAMRVELYVTQLAGKIDEEDKSSLSSVNGMLFIKLKQPVTGTPSPAP